MQSKGAKIGFIVLMILFGIGAYWLYNYGPFADSKNAAKKFYQNYVKAEAIIVSKKHNGRIGKGSTTIWTLQFKDSSGTLHTATMDQSTFTGRDNGDKITIYYNPENPNAVTDEDSYNEIMN